MTKIFVLALIATALIASTCEAGLFRKRDGSRRTPVRSVVKAGGCSNGSCSR